NSLSCSDFQNDILILAGDVTDDILLFEKVLEDLRNRFFHLIYVPGNHDLWVRYDIHMSSIDKLRQIKIIANNIGVSMEPLHFEFVSIVPLGGWYDYSFGHPSNETIQTWMDYRACRWPESYDAENITNYFITMNESYLDIKNDFIISFSHFVPRIDLLPWYIPPSKRELYPVLGTFLLEKQIRKLGSSTHVYGHSHINRQVFKDNTLYINNAFGYPYETRMTSKELKCIFET
ncbi:MAG: metallophosphoesterase, partial [Candidatus Hodarchaeota archaeon]